MILFGIQVRESNNVAVYTMGDIVTDAVILRAARTHGRELDLSTEQCCKYVCKCFILRGG